MNILGISAFYHDSAAALIQSGQIIAAAQEERFTRRKHDPSFPLQAIRSCLRIADLEAADLNVVAFYEKPFLKFDRLLKTYLAMAPQGLPTFLQAIPSWLRKKADLEMSIRHQIGYQGPISYVEHHQSHAASAFYPSPFQDAAILTVDGVGEWATTTLGVGEGNKIRLLRELRFPHSLGLLYSAFTHYAGFRVNSGEYKVMGLAPYGEPRYVDRIYDKLLHLYTDGSFSLDQNYFNYCTGLSMTNQRFHDLFEGEPRTPESPLTQKEMDLAASIQVVAEEVILRLARHAYESTGQKRLCMAGGVALNCVANGRILREGPFEQIWIQPAAGDAGGCLGAALFAWHQLLDRPRIPQAEDAMQGAFLGPAYSNQEIQADLLRLGAISTQMSDLELADCTARLLDQGKVVGWFQGRMEFGPRALGARSILGDARSPTMQSKMNLKIKFRESFRPFAPSILREHVDDYFDFAGESPYMLQVATVHKKRRLPSDARPLWGIDRLNVVRSDIPAITHIDFTARLQTVDRDRHGLFHLMLERFYSRTRCPVIVNTSFNVRGEPIVCTPEDAYRCFMATDIDALAIGNCLLFKEEQPALEGAKRHVEKFQLD